MGSPFSADDERERRQCPYTWAITGGTLPAGLAMTAGGVVSGTPTTANPTGANVTLKATDAFGCTGTQVVVVFKICPPVVIAPATMPNAFTNVNYNTVAGTLAAASGGVAPYTYSLSGAPAWLSIGSTTGQLAGTPTVIASGVTFTVTAADVNGCSVSKAYTINITPGYDYGDMAGIAVAGNIANSTLTLGALVDAEATPQLNSTATGDDLNNLDDEDSIASFPVFMWGATSQLTFTAVNKTANPAYVNIWIDFNSNLVLGSGEQVLTNAISSRPTIPRALRSATPCRSLCPRNRAAPRRNPTLRIRLTDVQDPGSSGIGTGIGEVEDYQLTIITSPYDFGDLPDTGTGTEDRATTRRWRPTAARRTRLSLASALGR